MAPAFFYQNRLTANGVSRTVKNMRQGNTASQLSVNALIFGINNIPYPDFGCYSLPHFIGTIHCNVGMLVNYPGSKMFSCCINYSYSCRCIKILTNLSDFAFED